MTEADKNFIETCKEILEHGYSSEGTHVRTRWEDGTEANYISIVGVSNKYDVSKEFPMITLRNNSKTVYKAGEMLGIQLIDHIVIGNEQYESIKNKLKKL